MSHLDGVNDHKGQIVAVWMRMFVALVVALRDFGMTLPAPMPARQAFRDALQAIIDRAATLDTMKD